MHRLSQSGAVNLFLAFVCISSAVAGEPADTVRKWGLIGEWSTEDCKLPLAARQRQTVWYRVDPDGSVIYDAAAGLMIVETAMTTAEGHISIRATAPATNEKTSAVIERSGGGIRVLMMRNVRLEYLVKDGIATPNGQFTKVLKRCS